VTLVDMPGLDERGRAASQVGAAETCRLIVWVASATQPARGPIRKQLDESARGARSWRGGPHCSSGADAYRRTAVRGRMGATYESPPATRRPRRSTAVNAVAGPSIGAWTRSCRSLMPAGRSPTISRSVGADCVELDEAKLVQLDACGRPTGTELSELRNQLLGDVARSV